MDLTEAMDAAEASENAPSPDLVPATPTPPEAAPAQVESVTPTEPGNVESYTVKVGGEEFQVTLDEALNGYQRQADYTHKTQQLAAEREQLSHAEQLWQAIETNPQATITAIAEAYGFKLTPAEAQALEAQRDAEPENLDPVEQRLREVEQFAERARFDQLQNEIDRELAGVHQRYGVEFDNNELLQYAVDHQIGNLDDAFKAFAFERVNQSAQDKLVQKRKETLSPVAGGHGVAAGTVTAGPAHGQVMSVEEAWAMAEAAHST